MKKKEKQQNTSNISWFENLKISKKLTGGFIVVACLGIIIGLVGIVNLISITNNQQEAYDQCTLGIEYSSKASSGLMELRSMVRDLYIYYDTDKETYISKISDQFGTIETYLDEYADTISDSADQANYDQMKAAYQSYKNDVNEILAAAQSSDTTRDDIYQLVASKRGNGSTADETFKSVEDYNVTLAESRTKSDKSAAWTSILVMIIVIVISFGLALFLGLFISGGISRPIQLFASFAELLAIGDVDVDKVIGERDHFLKYRKDEIGRLAGAFNKVIASTTEQAQKAKAIAEGDLTTTITIRSEHDILGRALSELVAKFHNLASSIVSSANQVDSGAKLVADSSTTLSQGATEQAGSVEELTASLEEITAQTAQNAQSAQTANDLSKNIKQAAESGNMKMEDMLRAMNEISVASDNISKIIKVIENIAFQTNILALNAAVEAARAGQNGRGFAVVADEVRNLAGKSSEAAKETTVLIESSIQKVRAGTEIANETASSLNKIVEGISEATELVASIAAASNEQAAALEQVNTGILQISQVSQSNAAVSEESAAASEELSSQADCLKEYVSVFKLHI